MFSGLELVSVLLGPPMPTMGRGIEFDPPLFYLTYCYISDTFKPLSPATLRQLVPSTPSFCCVHHGAEIFTDLRHFI
jgi:hypothetical protein